MRVIINRVQCQQILIVSDGEHISTMLHRLADELAEIDNREVESITWDDDGVLEPELIAVVHWRMGEA